MKKYFEILRKCSLFHQIGDEDLMPLLSCLKAQVRTYDKKETILAEGEPAKYIGIVLSGSVQGLRVDYYGNRSIVFHVEPSEVFAEAFACAGVLETPISVIANEPCEVMLIDCHCALHACAKPCGFHQQVIFNLMKDLAIKNILFHQKIEITAKRSTREKLMAYLMFQAKKANSNRFEIPFDRQELADYLGVERSGLSAEISKLQKEGVLKSHRKLFALL